MIRYLAFLAVLIGLATPSFAEEAAPQPRHALAMQGEPRYPADFAHLDYVRADAPKGGTLIEARAGTFDNVNPWILTASAPEDRLYFSYDRLMIRAYNEPYTVYGLVAETATVPDDRSWIEFALNENARFNDGVPVTADDVIFSFETLKKWGRANQRRVYSLVSEVRRIDDHRIRFVLGPNHDRETVMILAIMPVFAKHYWQGREFNTPTIEPPVTSGPYRLAKVDPGRSLTFERVRDYWGKDLPINVGLYNFDAIRVDFYRDDNIALEAFKAGAFNFRREMDTTKWLTGYDFPAIKDGRVTREVLPERRVDNTRGLIFNTRRPLFADRRVREALSYAFDFEWMNRALMGGMFRRINSYFPNSELVPEGPPNTNELALLEPFRNELPPEVFGPAYRPPETDGSGDVGLRPNLRKAMALLESAGWVVRDGQLVGDKTGKPFRFEILLQDPHDARIALPYAQALRRLGIAASVRVLDLTQYVGRRAQFDFDMIMDRWILTMSPGVEQMVYWGSKAADTPGSLNYAGVKSPAIDALASSIAAAPTRADMLDRVHALDRALTWGHYMIPLYYLGVDLVAYWQPICRPEVTPSWGLVFETWYAAPNGCPVRNATLP